MLPFTKLFIIHKLNGFITKSIFTYSSSKCSYNIIFHTIWKWNVFYYFLSKKNNLIGIGSRIKLA